MVFHSVPSRGNHAENSKLRRGRFRGSQQAEPREAKEDPREFNSFVPAKRRQQPLEAVVKALAPFQKIFLSSELIQFSAPETLSLIK
jgi:hypothetical protein